MVMDTPRTHGRTGSPPVPTRRALLKTSALAAMAAGAALLAACGGSVAGTAGGSMSTASGTAAGRNSVATAVTSAPRTTGSTAATALLATASRGTPVAAAAGETRAGAAATVELWLNWSGADFQAAMDQMAAQMVTQLPDLNVAWLINSQNETKLPAAIAAGTPPDVTAGGIAYPEIFAKGAATPIDDLLAKGTAIVKSDIPDPAWQYASYKGKTYGVPAIEAFARYGLCLDMTNLQQYGVDAKTLSWDWDTLTQLQQQATKTSGGAVQVLGIDPLSENGSFGAGSFFAQAWGISTFDAKTLTYNYDNEQLAEAMASIKKLYDLAGGPGPIATWRKQYPQWVGSATAAIPSGVQDMSIIAYFAPGQVAHDAPNRTFAFTWPPVPAAKKGYKIQTVGSHNLLIPAGAKHVAEAFQLIGFLVGDSAEQSLFDHAGFLGARLSFLKKVDTSKYPGLDFYFNSVQQADNVAGPLPDPISSFTGTGWRAAVQSVLSGKAQPADALKQLQQQVTTEYHQRFPNG